MRTILASVAVLLCLAACHTRYGENPPVSKEMKRFMGILSLGTMDATERALAKYAIPQLHHQENIAPFILKNPRVDRRWGDDCYTIFAEVDMKTRKYTICWEDRRITTIRYLGDAW